MSSKPLLLEGSFEFPMIGYYLPFGLRTAPFIFNLFADWILAGNISITTMYVRGRLGPIVCATTSFWMEHRPYHVSTFRIYDSSKFACIIGVAVKGAQHLLSVSSIYWPLSLSG